MADILEVFDFDDRPGLEKLKNIADASADVGEKFQKAGKDIEEAVDKSTRKSVDLDKAFKNISKTVGNVASIATKVAGAATLAFGAATAGAVALASHNDRIKEQQEGLAKQWNNLRSILAEKLAPAVYGIQQAFGDFLDGATKKANTFSSNFAVNLGAAFVAIGKTAKVFFSELDTRIKILKLEMKLLAEEAKNAFNPLGRQSPTMIALRAGIDALKKQTTDLGDTYDEAFKTAQKEIGILVDNGFFKLKRATKEELDAIKKLREAYAKFNEELDKRLVQSRIANAEGLERIRLEKEQIDEVINNLEKEGKAIAEKLGEEFQAEEKFIELRKNLEIAFQKERKELIDKTNEEIAKESRELFKAAFGIYFEDLEQLGKKASNEFRNDFEDAIAASVKNAQDFSKNAKPIGSDKGIFDSFRDQLLGSLNITPDEAGLIIGEVGNILQQTQELFTANIDRRIADNERLLDSIRERRNVLQNELDEELKLQAIGRENNVKSKQEELAKLAAQEQKAQKEREQLEKKQRRAQFAADLVQQVSSLTTAAANVFKANSNIPIVGVILGIAAVAALFAAFNAAKNKAASAAKGTNPLYRGGSLKGKLQNKSGFVNWLHGRPDKPGHGPGHRIEDSNIILGGREMIVAEEPANHQSDDFWDNMNSGRYNSLDLESTLDDHMTNPKTINTNFEKRQVKIVKIREANKQKGGYINEDQLNKAFAKHAKEMIRYFESKPEYVAFSEDQKIARIKESSKKINVGDSKEIFKAS